MLGQVVSLSKLHQLTQLTMDLQTASSKEGSRLLGRRPLPHLCGVSSECLPSLGDQAEHQQLHREQYIEGDLDVEVVSREGLP